MYRQTDRQTDGQTDRQMDRWTYRLIRVELLGNLPYRPGDKKQLKAQDVTAKLLRVDILRMVPKNILFCIKLT